MFTGEFKFDLNEAIRIDCQPQYKSAYTSTNEPIQTWMSLTPIKNPSVLTVAASGDQPLLYAANNASHIDTFDVTINACIIMDFKVTALQSMNHSEYFNTVWFLNNLSYANSNHPANKKMYNNTMNVVDKMPERTRAITKEIISKRQNLFDRENAYPSFPTHETTYEHLQQCVHQPFNFIWADLINVTNYIGNQKYDIINTSNIFDHYLWHGKSQQDIFDTVKKLFTHLNVGGYVLCTTVKPVAPGIFRRDPQIWDDINADVYFPTFTHSNQFLPIIIQKTR